MFKSVLVIPFFVLALILAACEGGGTEDRINGTWQSDDAGKYFKVLLTVDTKAKTGTLTKYDGEDVVMTHTEKIDSMKAEGNSVTLDMASDDGTKSQIVLTLDGKNKLVLVGEGMSLNFTRVKNQKSQ